MINKIIAKFVVAFAVSVSILGMAWAAEATALRPNAEVTKLPALVLGADSYMAIDGASDDVARPLQIVMNFKAKETVEEARPNGFLAWGCDFYLTFSGVKNGVFTAKDCYLAGNYGTFGWVVIPTDGMDLENDVTYPVLAGYTGDTEADLGITYKQICEDVKDFTAAIYVAPAILEANPDFKVTLELKMTNPEDENDVITIGEPAVYTVADLKPSFSISVPRADDVKINGAAPTYDEKTAIEKIVKEFGANTGVAAVETGLVAADNADEIAAAKAELAKLDVAEADANIAVPSVAVTLTEIKTEGDSVARMEFDVTPAVAVGEKSVKISGFSSAVTFRLPVPSTETCGAAKVYHNDELMGLYAVKGEGANKYIEVSSKNFSTFAVEFAEEEGVAVLDGKSYATLDDAVSAANAIVGKQVEITMLKDVAAFGGANITGNVVLDLNGKKIVSSGSSFFTLSQGNLVIKDSSDSNTGMLDGSVSAMNALCVYANSSLTIESGKVYAYNNVILTLYENTTVTVNGGELKSLKTDDPVGNVLYLVGSGASTVTVNGGVVDGPIARFDGELVVKGGKFKTNVSAYCPLGCVARQDVDGMYVVGPVSEGEALAKIGDVRYVSVAQALAAAKAANMTDVEITLVGETTQESALKLEDAFDLYYTTQFNSVTFKQEDASTPYYIDAIYTGSRKDGGSFVFDGVNIVVVGQYIFEGNVRLSGNSVVKSVTGSNCFIYNNASITVEPGSKLQGVIENLRGGNLVVDGGRSDGGYCEEAGFQDAIMAIEYSGDSLTLKNGAYVKINSADEIGRLSCAAGTGISLSASKLESVEYVDLAASSVLDIDLKSILSTAKVRGAGKVVVDASAFAGEPVKVIAADMSGFSGTVEVKGANVGYEISAEGLVIKAEAQIGNVYYPTLASAVEAAAEGDTVKVLCSVTLSGSFEVVAGKDLAIDLNGFTVSGITGASLVNAGELTIKDSSANMSGTLAVPFVNNGVANITGGMFVAGVTNNSEIEVAGGVYPADVDRTWIPEGYACGKLAVDDDLSYYLVAKLPTATTTSIPDAELKAAPNLTYSLKFKADDVSLVQMLCFTNWYADFELTVNKDVTFNAVDEAADGYLSGSYDSWMQGAWISMPTTNVTIKAGEPLRIMNYGAELLGKRGLKMTYGEVATFVKTFKCGVVLRDAFRAANPGFKIGLSLKMYNPDNEAESFTIGSDYEFEVPSDDHHVTVEDIYGNIVNCETMQDVIESVALSGEAANGGEVVLLKDVEIDEDITMTGARNLFVSLTEGTELALAENKKFTISNMNVAFVGSGSLVGFTAANVEIDDASVLTLPDTASAEALALDLQAAGKYVTKNADETWSVANKFVLQIQMDGDVPAIGFLNDTRRSYVIEASFDLVDWSPVEYAETTGDSEVAVPLKWQAPVSGRFFRVKAESK